MTFGAPINLSLLLLSIPIIAFHMVRSRRRRVVVPSTLVWRLMGAQAPSARAFRKLLPNLLLALQLLALTAITLALSRPEWGLVPSGTRPVVIVVDASGSMGAEDQEGGMSRLAAGASSALGSGFIPDGASCTVIRSAGEPEAVVRGVDRRRAVGAVRAMEPWQGATDLGEAVAAAEAVLSSAKTNGKGLGRLLVITDDPGFIVRNNKGLYEARTVRVAPRRGNLAVETLEARQDPGNRGSLRWLGTIRNLSRQRAEVTATLTVDGGAVYTRTLSIPPWGRASLPGDGGKPLNPRTDGVPQRATLSITPAGGAQDCLKSDNVRNLVMAGSRDTRVAIIRATGASATGPLTAALGAIPGIRLGMHGKGFVPPPGTTDLTVYDGFSPDGWPAGKSVIAGVLPSFLAERAAPRQAKPTEAIGWDTTHPLLRFIDPSGAGFSGAIPHAPITGGRVLIEGDRGPLLEEVPTGSGTTLVMPFRLEESEFIQRMAFPILVANLVQWASETKGPLGREPLIVGDLVDIRGKAAQATLAGLGLSGTPDPDGDGPLLRLEDPMKAGSKPSRLWRVGQPGFHYLASGSNRFPIAVNPLVEGESDTLHPRAGGKATQSSGAAVGLGTADDGKGDERPSSRAWMYFVALALLLVLLEWCMYASGRLGRGWPINMKAKRQGRGAV